MKLPFFFCSKEFKSRVFFFPVWRQQFCRSALKFGTSLWQTWKRYWFTVEKTHAEVAERHLSNLCNILQALVSRPPEHFAPVKAPPNADRFSPRKIIIVHILIAGLFAIYTFFFFYFRATSTEIKFHSGLNIANRKNLKIASKADPDQQSEISAPKMSLPTNLKCSTTNHLDNLTIKWNARELAKAQHTRVIECTDY